MRIGRALVLCGLIMAALPPWRTPMVARATARPFRNFQCDELRQAGIDFERPCTLNCDFRLVNCELARPQ
jgi:hypothetical protein